MEWGKIVAAQQSGLSSVQPRRAYAIAIPLILLLALIFVRPVPLVGGYTDDFRYLTGAQCLDCLPTNHWERRFAIVWPTGIAIKLFGQNLWSVMIFPVAAAVAAVVLTFKLVERQYGRKAALIASCALVLTPVFTERSMRVAVDVIELAFLLGAVFVLQRRKGHFWAGALLALAVLCRPTMFAALPMVAFLAWWQDRHSLKWFALGFVVPLASEALVYFIATGDPLYPWKLSLDHMRAWKLSMEDVRYSQFMSPDVDTSQSPLFNPDYIGGWVPVAGIEAHWTVQGIINLMLSGESGLVLCAGLILSLLAWKQLDRLQVALIASAALFFGALTYGFAVDPRPRMFLPIIVIGAVLIGSLVRKPWPWPRNVAVATFLTLIVLVGVIRVWDRTDYRRDAEKADKLLAQKPYSLTSNARQRLALIRQEFPRDGRYLIEIDDRCRPRIGERWLAHRDRNLCIYADMSYLADHQRTQAIISPAAEWIAAHPGQIEIEPNARNYLSLQKSARELPGLDSNSPYLLYNGPDSCESWLARNGLPEGSLSVVEEEPSSRMAFLLPEWSGSLCLFRYERQLPASEVGAAVLRQDTGGRSIFAWRPRNRIAIW